MPHELDLLTRLVVGDLSPASFNLHEPATHRDYLRHRFGTFVRHFKTQYLATHAGEFSYQCHDEFVFQELDELPRLPAGAAGPEPRTLGLLLADALPRFGIPLPQLQDANCCRIGDQYFLEITATSDFAILSAAKARYFYYHTQLLDEAARLRRVIPSRALQQPDAAAVARYVQQHQRTLQGLLSHVQEQIGPACALGCYGAPREYTPSDVQQMFYVGLEKLLAYFEQIFPEHLNLTAPLTFRRRVQALTDVQTPLSAVLMALHSAEGLPERLSGFVNECLTRLLITVHDTSLSYQDLLYPRLLLRELHGRLQRGWPLTAQTLTCLLVRYNFNSLSFFSFLTAHLRAGAEAAGASPADQLAVVLLHLKLYRQLQPATELFYAPVLPPLRTQMISWLKEERDYLTCQVQAQTEGQTSASAKPTRILTPLSVAQMAQLLRTLYDAGVFGEANQRDLFRLLATNFRTARQENISGKSLADKYYNAEDSTRQAVEKLVAKMLAQLRTPH